MPRSFRRQNRNILITLTLFLLAVTYIKHKDDLLWRKLYHYPTSLVPAYRAPLLYCHPPYTLADTYYVRLHHRCTLEQHNETLGEGINLDLVITDAHHETARWGPAYYRAEGVDDVVLSAVRGDLKVDMVECVERPEPYALWDEKSSTWVDVIPEW